MDLGFVHYARSRASGFQMRPPLQDFRESCGCDQFHRTPPSEAMNFEQVRVEDNVVGDSMVLVFTKHWTPDYDPYHIGYSSTHTQGDNAVSRELIERGNILADPGLVDARGGDFRLRDSSPAWKAGFRRIPIENIGLVVDEFRRSISH